MSEPFVTVPLSPMRRVIATRMEDAVRTIPHFRVSAEVRLDAAVSLRARLKTERPRAPLSLNHLVIKAAATALAANPLMNIQWVDGSIRRLPTADIAIVTALPDGLSTPILRAADRKPLWEIAEEATLLVERARLNQLKMEEVFGGSFSISTLGRHEIVSFDAIINPPQCAILAVAAASSRLVVGRDGAPAVAQVMTVTLSADHRAIDGVLAAKFLTSVRNALEEPESLCSSEAP